MRTVYTIAYDGVPHMDGPHTIRMGEFPDSKTAEAGLRVMRERSVRSPKRNLRIQKRQVSEWEDA